MTSPSSDSRAADLMITRREALRRAAGFLGVALSPSLVAGVLQAAAAAAPGGPPRHLRPEQFETIAAVAERILPRTDTPGAREVGVPQFIDVLYGGYLTAEEKSRLTAGLADLGRRARSEGGSVAQLPADRQDELLRAVARESQGKDKSFFGLVRELTITGYFTSETVGRTVLHYDPVPGGYQGCIPLAEVGNVSWTR